MKHETLRRRDPERVQEALPRHARQPREQRQQATSLQPTPAGPTINREHLIHLFVISLLIKLTCDLIGSEMTLSSKDGKIGYIA